MRPLDGIRVLDLATFIAAPLTASILGEFGAEVIKIEHPEGGDPMRRFGTATDDPDRTLACCRRPATSTRSPATCNRPRARGH